MLIFMSKNDHYYYFARGPDLYNLINNDFIAENVFPKMRYDLQQSHFYDAFIKSITIIENEMSKSYEQLISALLKLKENENLNFYSKSQKTTTNIPQSGNWESNDYYNYNKKDNYNYNYNSSTLYGWGPYLGDLIAMLFLLFLGTFVCSCFFGTEFPFGVWPSQYPSFAAEYVANNQPNINNHPNFNVHDFNNYDPNNLHSNGNNMPNLRENGKPPVIPYIHYNSPLRNPYMSYLNSAIGNTDNPDTMGYNNIPTNDPRYHGNQLQNHNISTVATPYHNSNNIHTTNKKIMVPQSVDRPNFSNYNHNFGVTHRRPMTTSNSMRPSQNMTPVPETLSEAGGPTITQPGLNNYNMRNFARQFMSAQRHNNRIPNTSYRRNQRQEPFYRG